MGQSPLRGSEILTHRLLAVGSLVNSLVEPVLLFQHNVANNTGRQWLQMIHILRDEPQSVSIIQQPIVGQASASQRVDRGVADHNS